VTLSGGEDDYGCERCEDVLQLDHFLSPEITEEIEALCEKEITVVCHNT
jgi:hypothetical protein